MYTVPHRNHPHSGTHLSRQKSPHTQVQAHGYAPTHPPMGGVPPREPPAPHMKALNWPRGEQAVYIPQQHPAPWGETSLQPGREPLTAPRHPPSPTHVCGNGGGQACPVKRQRDPLSPAKRLPLLSPWAKINPGQSSAQLWVPPPSPERMKDKPPLSTTLLPFPGQCAIPAVPWALWGCRCPSQDCPSLAWLIGS